jgi:uncharacterized membrane protein
MRRPMMSLLLVVFMAFLLASPVLAAGETPTPAPVTALTVTTPYPGQVIGIGESVTLTLTIKSPIAQVVKIQAQNVPQGWTVTYRGGGNVIDQAYVAPGQDATVDMAINPPADVKAGTYTITTIVQGGTQTAQLDVSLTVKEKLPPKLSMTTDLPTIKGSPTTTFSYNVTIKNEGDEDLNVNLNANAPSDFQVTFNLLGNEVTSFPLSANSSKSLSVQVKPVGQVSAGSYPVDIIAQGGSAQASLTLTAVVTGQISLSITTPDGRLSSQATVGKDTPIQLVVQNNGSAPAQGITLSASPPSGWNVTFDPKQIDQIQAGKQVNVTMHVTPSDQAIAGDYMVTVSATPADGAVQSADFRITVVTSTLWGIAGIALIAVAVGVVGIAVVRFGRR